MWIKKCCFAPDKKLTKMAPEQLFDQVTKKSCEKPLKNLTIQYAKCLKKILHFELFYVGCVTYAGAAP